MSRSDTWFSLVDWLTGSAWLSGVKARHLVLIGGLAHRECLAQRCQGATPGSHWWIGSQGVDAVTAQARQVVRRLTNELEVVERRVKPTEGS